MNSARDQDAGMGNRQRCEVNGSREMTDTTDLIQRLRDCANEPWKYALRPIALEAADALEQQAAQIAEKDAEIARLTAELETLKGDLDPLLKDITEADELADLQSTRIQALRADAERLRAVADAASVYYEHYMQDEAESPEYCVCGDEQHQRAVEVRDSLAALRQEQPTKGEGA